MNISEVSEFSILAYTENRKLGNPGNMSLPSNSDSSYNSSFKTTKMWTERKTERFQYDLKKINKTFRDFRVFDFALYQISKTWKSRKFCLPRILTLVVAQDLNTPKK